MVMLVRPFEVLCKIDDAVKNEISMGCYARFEEYWTWYILLIFFLSLFYFKSLNTVEKKMNWYGLLHICLINIFASVVC